MYIYHWELASSQISSFALEKLDILELEPLHEGVVHIEHMTG